MPMQMFSPSSGKTLRAGSSSGSVTASVGASVTGFVIGSVSCSVFCGGSAVVTASVAAGSVSAGSSVPVQAAAKRARDRIITARMAVSRMRFFMCFTIRVSFFWGIWISYHIFQ